MPVIETGGLQYYLDGYLKYALDTFKKYLKKHNQDNVFIITGREGRGKTTLALQICKYYDPTFNETRVFTTSDDLIDGLENAQEGQAFLYDEGQEFTSRGALTKLNRNLVYALSMIRVKKLYIGICIPNFFELDRYPAIHRSEFLLYVHTHKGHFGHFRYYSWVKKKELYLEGKKKYNYDAVESDFWGKFVKKFVIDEKKYNENKLESWKRALKRFRSQTPKAVQMAENNATRQGKEENI